MKIAVFSDVHGNYINLLSFFESAKKLKIDKFICLGDLCNYYPDNKKVIEFFIENNILCLLGNHDELYGSDKALTGAKKIAYNYDESLVLNNESKIFLSKLPLKYEMFENNKAMLFCHASPSDLIYTYIYPDTDLTSYENMPYDIVFMGHTHRQFLREQNNKLFCNVGSVGMPRDNGSLLGFAVIDTCDNGITLYRKKINIEKVKLAYENNTPLEVLQLLSRQEVLNYNYTLL